ncbi:AMP-binding protein [Acidovorax radicis]|jgi:2-aminobenzoate-CoA ligase|uniref:AMP-binding protein n=1 Tax=Acidovorax radicis TaxID=758826 RepID=UPI001CFBB061|nr:AMP-binding protein [Acidovorax radicis]UCU99714.1 AMP-binding protein [Acidovorax radicis]
MRFPSAQPDHFVHDRLPPTSALPTLRYDLPELQIANQANLVHALFDQAERAGHIDRPFLRGPHRTYTYRDARTEAARIAEVLTQDHGLVPGNRVLLRGGNTVEMALAWLGTVYAGLVAVATMPLLRAGELGSIIDRAQPTLALCDGRLLAELQTAQAQHPVLATIVPFHTAPNAADLLQRSQGKPGTTPPCPTSADDIALMAFTSGTTGVPKAPVHTHRDVLAACEAWPRHVLRATPDDIVAGSPPLAFTFGLGGLLLFPMWAGASVYFPDQPYTPETMVRLMREAGVTICYTAPTFYRQMAPFAQQLGLPRLRICVSAGEALPDATRRLWHGATGIDMTDGIGATEMFHIFISSAGGSSRPGAIGKVVPGYTARVVDDDDNEVPRGTVGKLAVIGPTGCRYLDDSRQSQYVRHGWNHPGDAFTQDADGYFFYQARDDDMIITAGYNVGGPEVEDALLRHPAVAECGVIGVPDEERGMVVKAICVLKPGHTGDAAMVKALQDHVKATIAPFKYPRVIEFASTLPRTETGKLQRFKLRQAAQQAPRTDT